MPRVLTEDEIASLLAEPKPLPANWAARLSTRAKSSAAFGHRELDVDGTSGGRYRLVIRTNRINPLDFSLILLFRDTDGSEYRLVRFNGRHPSQHTNKLEKAAKLDNASFRNRFHIHTATERYQLEGFDIDGYAEPTDRYDSFESALREFVRSNGLLAPDAAEWEPGLFEQGEEGRA